LDEAVFLGKDLGYRRLDPLTMSVLQSFFQKLHSLHSAAGAMKAGDNMTVSRHILMPYPQGVVVESLLKYYHRHDQEMVDIVRQIWTLFAMVSSSSWFPPVLLGHIHSSIHLATRWTFIVNALLAGVFCMTEPYFIAKSFLFNEFANSCVSYNQVYDIPVDKIFLSPLGNHLKFQCDNIRWNIPAIRYSNNMYASVQNVLSKLSFDKMSNEMIDFIVHQGYVKVICTRPEGSDQKPKQPMLPNLSNQRNSMTKKVPDKRRYVPSASTKKDQNSLYDTRKNVTSTYIVPRSNVTQSPLRMKKSPTSTPKLTPHSLALDDF
jgi:hypothetical protein